MLLDQGLDPLGYEIQSQFYHSLIKTILNGGVSEHLTRYGNIILKYFDACKMEGVYFCICKIPGCLSEICISFNKITDLCLI